jgi:hypothetical protein
MGRKEERPQRDAFGKKSFTSSIALLNSLNVRAPKLDVCLDQRRCSG